MELDDVAGAGALMEAVDVLRHHADPGEHAPQLGDRDVPRVGRGRRRRAEAVLVPDPDELGLAHVRFVGGELHRVVLRPEAGLGLAEGGDARLLAHTGAREHDQLPGARDGVGGWTDMLVHGYSLRGR